MLLIRTMTYYKDFFAKVVGSIREICPDLPIVAGGPHPTVSYIDVLANNDIQACVIGEGELTCAEIAEYMLATGHFPDRDALQNIRGLAIPAGKQ